MYAFKSSVLEAHRWNAGIQIKRAKFEKPNLEQVHHELVKSWRIVRLNQWAKNIISMKTGFQTPRTL